MLEQSLVAPSPAVAVAEPSPSAAPTPAALKRSAQAMAYFTDDKGRPQGSLHPFSVTVQPGPREQEFRLGFFETYYNRRERQRW